MKKPKAQTTVCLTGDTAALLSDGGASKQSDQYGEPKNDLVNITRRPLTEATLLTPEKTKTRTISR